MVGELGAGHRNHLRPLLFQRHGLPLPQPSDSEAETRDRDALFDALGRALLKALIADFAEHGRTAVAKLRTDEPKTYLALIARLAPAGTAREGDSGVVVTTTMNLGGGDG